MVTAILVTRSGTWLAVPKYSGTKASQITHVVYIVNPAEGEAVSGAVGCAFYLPSIIM